MLSSAASTQKKVSLPSLACYLLLYSRQSAGVAWPELLGALFSASRSNDAGQRETAFRIFSTTPGIIEKQHEDVVMGAFKGGFADSDTSVQFELAPAFSAH